MRRGWDEGGGGMREGVGGGEGGIGNDVWHLFVSPVE